MKLLILLWGDFSDDSSDSRNQTADLIDGFWRENSRELKQDRLLRYWICSNVFFNGKHTAAILFLMLFIGDLSIKNGIEWDIIVGIYIYIWYNHEQQVCNDRNFYRCDYILCYIPLLLPLNISWNSPGRSPMIFLIVPYRSMLKTHFWWLNYVK